MLTQSLSVLGKGIRTLRGYRMRDAKDDASVQAIRAELRGMRFEAATGHMREIRDADTMDWILAGLSEWSGRPKCLDAWVEQNARCGEAYLVRGAHGVQWAWAARAGGDPGGSTGANSFQERLQMAESDLQKAARLLPKNAAPYIQLILCSIGKSDPPAKVNQYFQAAKTRAPNSWNAHLFAQTYLCQKWMGTHEKMFSFSKKTMLGSRRGSGLGAVVAVAHVERYLYLLAFERDEAAAENYWKRASVRDDLMAAYRHSLGAPNYRETAVTPWQRNHFAFALSSAGMTVQAGPLFESLGKTHTEFPWTYFGDPTFVFVDAKLNATEE